jgi:uncharacterized lipoprotein YajG
MKLIKKIFTIIGITLLYGCSSSESGNTIATLVPPTNLSVNNPAGFQVSLT